MKVSLSPPRVRLSRLTDFDWFMLGNCVLWSSVILFGYQWRRLEFYVYVLLVLLQVAGMALAWVPLRQLRYPLWLLVMLQVAIAMHLAGGSIFVGDARLYDLHLLPYLTPPAWFSQMARYDKLLHAYFAAVGAVGLSQIWPQLGLGSGRRTVDLVVIGFLVLGLGGAIEVAEYVGTKLVHLPEVGGYDNNLQDLLANGFGIVTATLLVSAARSAPGGGEEP